MGWARLAVVVVAVALAGSACGSGDGGVVVPAEAPAGRCAEHISFGVYEWESCAWEPYRESADHNRALSDADADAFIGRIWREVEVEGKPATPPTSALVPRDIACGSSIFLGCYDWDNHHIDRSDPFTTTLLHEVAHALTRDHPSMEECPPTVAGHPYATCSHGDIFRCVADRLFTDYAGIPSAGVCGIAHASGCTPVYTTVDIGGLVVLCQVENTTWFRFDGPEEENVSWSYLEPESHTLEYPDPTDSPTLDIVCDNGLLSVYIDFYGLNVSGEPVLGQIPVRYEFDGSPTEEAWEESDFGEFAFSPYPEAFATSLAASQELVFKAWNPDGSLVGTIVFDTTGADTEVNRVLTACGIR